MAQHLCLSVGFLDTTFHGRSDGGEPEWPPSPMRLFQALVAAMAARAGGCLDDRDQAALRWLEARPAPVMVAPPVHVGQPVRLAVPNNDMDIPASAWAQGRAPSKQPNELKTMKTVRPTHLLGRDRVHYLFPLTGDEAGHVETLCAAARAITHLGWGVNLVASHGRIIREGTAEDPQLIACDEVWRPSDDPEAEALRVPRVGSLEALIQRHGAFLTRLNGDGYAPAPALTAFAVIGYRRATDPPARRYVAFDIWKPLAQLAGLRSGQTRYRPFDPVRRTPTVAALVRHAAARAADRAGWSLEEVNTFIHGHTPDGEDRASGEGADRRLAFLPLPSITPRGVEEIRRVMVVLPPGEEARISWVRQALSGQELIAEKQAEPVAMLSMLPDGDANVGRYVGPAQVWATVTPVVLPGRFVNGPGRVRRLLRNALRQAG
ncbi:MAG: type I-U CRISPR-associated protein Csb2, partial [Gemmataceae bacterium]